MAANTMAADNERMKRDAEEASIMRYSKAQPYEQEAVLRAHKLAGKIAQRVTACHMENLPLPLSYVVKTVQLKGSADMKTYLFKVLPNGVEIPINEKDPIVEACLNFYRDCVKGLIPKIEEMYQARLKEFADAKEYLQGVLDRGIEEYQGESVPIGDVNADGTETIVQGQAERDHSKASKEEPSRWDFLGN